MLRESCEQVPTCDDPQIEKAEDGCNGDIGWQGVADCVPWQAGVCHAGHREGSTAGLARRRRSGDFSARSPNTRYRGLITTPRDAKCALGFKCDLKCGPPPDTFSASAPVTRHFK